MEIFEFVKVRDKWFGIDYKWLLKITNLIQIMKYELRDSRYKIAFANYLKDKDKDKFHQTDGLENLIDILSKFKGSSFLGEMEYLSIKAGMAMREILLECGVIYINRSGGFFPGGKENIEEYSKIVKSNKLLFPSDKDRDIRFIQWSGGKHWYIKMDNMDIVVDGEQKWNTKDKAKEALNKWLN